MPRPRKYESHKLEAYDIYRQRKATGEGISALGIQVDLEAEHPEGTASYRLIASWVKEFNNRDEWQTLLESPFQWHKLEEFGLPWEASSFLLEMWVFVLKRQSLVERAVGTQARIGTGPPIGVPPMPAPTVREARWWWRVHLAAPDLSNAKVWNLGNTFSLCEMAHHVLGRPSELGDLEAYLAYRPWTSDQAQKEYQRAIEAGHIPGLRTDVIDIASAISEQRGEEEGMWVPSSSSWGVTYLSWKPDEEDQLGLQEQTRMERE